MKKLLAVAVAGILAVSSTTHAAWDYFSVIDAGSGEANVAYSAGDGYGVKVRYGLMENLEIMAAADGYGLHSDFLLGGRYQIMDMLAFSLDFGIPTANGGAHDIGVAPGLQFSMDVNDMISFGVGAALGINLNHLHTIPVNADSTEMLMQLDFGLEVDFKLSDNVLVWVGCDFSTGFKDGDEMTISPAFGAVFSATESLDIGTFLGIDLDRMNRKGEESIGLTGGFDFTIRF